MSDGQSFDVFDLPTTGDIITVGGIDHVVDYERTTKFHSPDDDGVLRFEFLVRASASTPTPADRHPPVSATLPQDHPQS